MSKCADQALRQRSESKLQTTAVFRVDGSHLIGMGHVMRCIAIAEAFRATDVDAVFVTKDLPGKARQIIAKYGFGAVPLDAGMSTARDAEATAAIAHDRRALAIVVDLGHVDMLADEEGFIDFLERLGRSGCPVAVIEGMDAECISMRRALPVGAIVVPYFEAEQRRYLALPGVRVFAGVRYFPFRAEFRAHAEDKRMVEACARRILVSIGGGDVTRHNGKVAAALALLQRDDLDIRMTGELPAGTAFAGCKTVPGDNMAELISWADLAIISSGLIRYETALLGTPAVVFSIRSAHAPMVEAFAAAGAVRHCGVIDDVSVDAMSGMLNSLIEDRPTRAHMAARGRAIVDCNGASALVAGIRGLAAVGVGE